MLQKTLLNWFHKNARPLPWRRHYKPYEVWISEIMLQQTQVNTMLPYFEKWLNQFPDIRTLALSEEKKVLKVWEGLGYYSRARNLHHSAKIILERYDGKFPDDFDSIRQLKGVGRYTAGAIASIAFNQDRPIVDGNVLRVLSRLYAIEDPIDAPQHKETFWRLQEKLIPPGQARYFNQALMELGALVCTKQDPSCKKCPLQRFCRAYKKGIQGSLPVKAGSKKMVRIDAIALAIEHQGHYFIHERPKGKIMGGLWEFPESKVGSTSNSKKTGLLEFAKQHLRIMGCRSGKLVFLGIIKRNYTNHLESLHCFKVSLRGKRSIRSAWPSAWVPTAHFTQYPFSSAHAKLAALITKGSS